MLAGFEELDNSPKVVINRRGGSGVQMFRGPWSQIDALIAHLFPDQATGAAAYTLPGFSWLEVDSISLAPFLGPPTESGGVNTYQNVDVTVNYAPPAERQGMQSGTGGTPDASGPGGKDGSTGGAAGNEQTYVKHKVSVGGEFLVWPTNGLMWENGITPGLKAVDDNGNINAAEVKLKDHAVTSVVIPIMEHQITWSFVAYPPWSVMRQCLGRINSKPHAGAPAGCLLFLGAEAEREITSKGYKVWNLEYKFSEKNYSNDPGAPQGWNYFLRPETGRFERILKKPRTTGGKIASAILTAALTATTNSITNPDILKEFPVTGNFRITVGKEEIMVYPMPDNKWKLIRGYNGTKAAAHPLASGFQEATPFIYDQTDFAGLFGYLPQ